MLEQLLQFIHYFRLFNLAWVIVDLSNLLKSRKDPLLVTLLAGMTSSKDNHLEIEGKLSIWLAPEIVAYLSDSALKFVI